MGHTPLDPEARGLLIGLTRDSRPGHIARAALEGIALAVTTLTQLAEQALGQPLQELAVDGGAAASDLLLQAQADSSGVPVRRPDQLESTALGVALLAGLSAGCLSDLNAARQVRAAGSRRFDPALNKAERERWLKRWDSAVHRCLEWHGDALR